jgi:hypothetical protein
MSKEKLVYMLLAIVFGAFLVAIIIPILIHFGIIGG